MRSGKLSLFTGLSLTLLISGCSSQTTATEPTIPLSPQPVEAVQPAVQILPPVNSDTNLVSNLHRQQLHKLSYELTLKLYKRNPRELQKDPQATLASRLAQLFPAAHHNADNQPLPRIRYAELYQKDSINAVQLAFAPDFKGDRVFALMVGITGMINASYDHRQNTFTNPPLNPQKLYDSARNLEIVDWQLRTRKGTNGRPLILSTGTDSKGVVNLSYERLFGKMIAHQDMLAQIVARSHNVQIREVIKGSQSRSLRPL